MRLFFCLSCGHFQPVSVALCHYLYLPIAKIIAPCERSRGFLRDFRRFAIDSNYFQVCQSIERSFGFSGLSESDPEAIYPKPWDSHGIPTSSHRMP